MKKLLNSSVITIASLVVGIAHAQAVLLPPSDAAVVLPLSLPGVWDSQRTAIVNATSSSERISESNQLIQDVLNSTSLSVAERVNGVQIAGSALFIEGDNLGAVYAFKYGLWLNPTDDVKGDLCASIAEVYRVGVSDYESAYTYYNQAMSHYKLGYASSGAVSSLKPIPSMHLLNLALDLDKHSEGLAHAEYMISKYDNAQSEEFFDRSFFVFTAAQLAKEIDDPAFLVHAKDLLNSDPDYLNNSPNLGLIPKLKIAADLKAGSNWDHPDQRLVDTVLEIVQNPDYQLMPARVSFANRLACSWERLAFYDAAVGLRTEVLHGVDSVIAGLGTSQSDRVLGNSLTRQKTICQWNTAVIKYHEQDDGAGAALLLAEIINETAYPQPDFIAMASDLLTEINASP